MSILSRFAGPAGQPILIEALKNQFIVNGDLAVATKLSKLVSVAEHPAHAKIITQDDSTNDLFFILAGQVKIEINGREIAIRSPGQHVGEMALIESSALRSASVICINTVVTAKIEESQFTPLANENPYLWRRISAELSNRLRQRSIYVRQKNDTPVLFLGSSKESLPIVTAIQEGLASSPIIVRPWTAPGVFHPSKFPIEDLADQLKDSDFAALVLGADDKILSRGKAHKGPRDNVILELGLFMGAIERLRTFLVVPKGADVKIPTDLLGINPIWFENSGLIPDVTSACEELKTTIATLGCR